MFVFRKIWCALFPRNPRFEIDPFALLPTNFQNIGKKKLIYYLSRENNLVFRF